jgi:hypothetical protein
MPLAGWPTAALPMAALTALVQLTGGLLAGGVPQGSAILPLERAEGGDTPVLRFETLAPYGASAAIPGSGPVRLLLDTGASTTMVSPALAARLGLATTTVAPGSFALAGGGQGCGTLAPRRTRLPDLRLSPSAPEAGSATGALRLRGVEALVLPVAALPAGIDGVLGAPTLRQLPILIDPPAGRLVLGPAALAGAAALPPPLLRLPLRWRHGVPLLTLASRSGPVQALADTGAEGLFLSPALASRLEPLGPAEPLRLVGVCGEQAVRRQRFRGLALPAEPVAGGPAARPIAPGTAAAGDLTTPLEGIVTDTPVFGGLGVEAIVGQEWLRHRRQLWRLDRSPPELLLW